MYAARETENKVVEHWRVRSVFTATGVEIHVYTNDVAIMSKEVCKLSGSPYFVKAKSLEASADETKGLMPRRHRIAVARVGQNRKTWHAHYRTRQKCTDLGSPFAKKSTWKSSSAD